MRRSGLALLAVFTAGVSTSCAIQHRDVLVFGTQTKFAVDLVASSDIKGTPEITVGYKRREFVLMPLLVNGSDSRAFSTDAREPPGEPEAEEKVGSSSSESAKYVGSGQNSNGLPIRDAYSVFASFGATYKAQQNGSNQDSGGSLAQFFATGVAAQHLGANATIANALSTKPPAVVPSTMTQILKNLSPAEQEALTNEVSAQLASNQSDVDAALEMLKEADGSLKKATWDKVIDHLSVDPLSTTEYKNLCRSADGTTCDVNMLREKLLRDHVHFGAPLLLAAKELSTHAAAGGGQ